MYKRSKTNVLALAKSVCLLARCRTLIGAYLVCGFVRDDCTTAAVFMFTFPSRVLSLHVLRNRSVLPSSPLSVTVLPLRARDDETQNRPTPPFLTPLYTPKHPLHA